jgi:DNA-binding CsgD family transcriptional regulator
MSRANDVAKRMNVLSMESIPTRKDAVGTQAVRAEARMLDVSFAGFRRKSRSKFISPFGTKGVSPVDQLDLYNFPVPSERLLRACFNLTPAEIRLAQIISRGEPLRYAADLLGIKMPTARSQLASVFLKTKTLRQPQLVALLSRLAHLNPWLTN